MDMKRRELHPDEWTSFFNCFSRQYKGRPVTIELQESGPLGEPRVIVRNVPLMGIAAESRDGSAVQTIEVLVGASPQDHFMHTINQPSRVMMEQLTNGEDEVILIESAIDPAIRIDFTKRPGVECPGGTVVEAWPSADESLID